jgi:hypothetical protein
MIHISPFPSYVSHRSICPAVRKRTVVSAVRVCYRARMTCV